MVLLGLGCPGRRFTVDSTKLQSFREAAMVGSTSRVAALLAMLAACCYPVSASAQCTNQWLTGIGIQGTNGVVLDTTT